jgi:peptidoglycan/LPS O-acetylase OafA/YrhL
MRRLYIDNIRSICILLLFPYHTFMIYNAFGEGFYVKGPNIPLTTGFMFAIGPWFMPLLFVVAGVSSFCALQKRKPSQYIKERVLRLLIPLIAGVLLLVPAQTYFAERFHNGYAGGYLAQYALFFTKPTDLTGYKGGFTPAHLWFIFYLFIISLAALPVIMACKRAKRPLTPGKIPMPLLVALFVAPFLMQVILDIEGKSVGEFFAYFMLGYFLLSDENLLQKLVRYRFALLAPAVLLMAGVLLIWYGVLEVPPIAEEIVISAYAWIAILAIFGLGRRYLNAGNSLTSYLASSSFPVYIFHQTCLVAVAYVVFRLTGSVLAQIVLIMAASLVLTYLMYEVCRRLPGLRLLFGIKPAPVGGSGKKVAP